MTDLDTSSSSSSSPASSDFPPPTRAERFENYMNEMGLSPSDVPKAVIIHEGLGLGLLGGIWAACFAVQPSVRVVRPLRAAVGGSLPGEERLGGQFEAAMVSMEQRVKRYVPAGSDPRRLVVSLAESAVARNLARPVTIPLKLWLTYRIMTGMSSSRQRDSAR